jgi:hypothetical protein
MPDLAASQMTSTPHHIAAAVSATARASSSAPRELVGHADARTSRHEIRKPRKLVQTQVERIQL